MTMRTIVLMRMMRRRNTPQHSLTEPVALRVLSMTARSPELARQRAPQQLRRNQEHQ